MDPATSTYVSNPQGQDITTNISEGEELSKSTLKSASKRRRRKSKRRRSSKAGRDSRSRLSIAYEEENVPSEVIAPAERRPSTQTHTSTHSGEPDGTLPIQGTSELEATAALPDVAPESDVGSNAGAVPLPTMAREDSLEPPKVPALPPANLLLKGDVSHELEKASPLLSPQEMDIGAALFARHKEKTDSIKQPEPVGTLPEIMISVSLVTEGHVLEQIQAQPSTTDGTEMKTAVIRSMGLAFIAIVPMAVVLIALLLSSILPPYPSDVPCQTHECRQYGRRLVSSLNTSVDPCHSFTHFVCDGWQRHNVLSVQHDLVWQALDRVGRLVRHMDIPVTMQNDVQRAAAVYKSCDDVLQGIRDELPNVRRALAEAGIVWPHRPVNVRLLRVLLYSSLRLGWDVFLRVGLLRVDGRDLVTVGAGALFLQLSERYVIQKTARENEDYFNAFRKAFTNVDKEGASETVSFKQTMSLEAYGMSALFKSYGFEKISTDLPSSVLGELGVRNLGESSWHRIFDELGLNVTSGFSFRVLSLEYLKTLVEIWRLLGEENMYWLVSWGTVQVAALYANRDLILKLYGGPPVQAFVRHGVFCLSRAYRFSRHALFTKYRIEVLPEYSINGAEQLTLIIRESVRELLSSWIHYSNSPAIVANWSSIETNFGAFRESSEHDRDHDANASDPLSSLSMGESFVDNWRKSVLLPEFDDWDADIVKAMVSLQFAALRLSEDFQVIPYSLSFLHYDTNLANVLNFGGLGFLVALELGRLFLGAYQQDASKRMYVKALLDCIVAGAFSRGTNHETAMAEIITGKAVVDTYVNEASHTYDRLEDLEGYEGTQLLFIASCYLKCRGSYYGNFEGLCDMSFQYLPAFAEAFQCPRGTPMNPIKLCSLPDLN